MKGIAKEFVPPVLWPLPDAAPAALVCVAFAAAAQQLSSVLLLRALFVVGISFVIIAELSAEFLVYYCVHNVDGNVVLVIFVFMMQGQGEAQFGLYPSRTRRHAHPVGLRHAPSFQQFGLRVLRESPGKLSSGSWFVNSGMRDSGSEFDGLFKMCPSGVVSGGFFTDTVSGAVVGPSGVVLDGISADTFDVQRSAAAFCASLQQFQGFKNGKMKKKTKISKFCVDV